MTREGIIARRRELQVPDKFQEQWVTLADVGFEGNWVSPIQKISNSMTGPVLVAKHWLDAESVNQNRAILECLGYLPDIRFNQTLDQILASVGRRRKDIYITQACHFLPRDDRRQPVPTALMGLSIKAVTRHECEGRKVIALGGEAQAALRRADVDFLQCPHPSSSVAGRYAALADMLRRATTSFARSGLSGRKDMQMPSQEPDIIGVLKRHPDGATIDMLAQILNLTEEKEVRNRIDSARRRGYNIVRIARNTFQLKCGTWRGRRD